MESDAQPRGGWLHGAALCLLLLSLLLAPATGARPADVPLRRLATEGEVNLHRQPRPLSREEIFRAIQNDLTQRGISGRRRLRPEDLKIQASVPVFERDLGLQVKKIGYDPIRRETVFELWASHEPQFLPFEVTTRRDRQSLGLSVGPSRLQAGAAAESSVSGPGKSRAPSRPPVLAKPGMPATLVMLGQNVRVTTTVVPLQPGIKGQRILVRDMVTARVMTAEVVDQGLLRSSF